MHLESDTLHALADGELSAADRQEAEAHLAHCGACAARFEALRRFVAVIGSVPESRLTADLSQGVVAQLSQPVQIGWRARWAVVTQLALGIGSVILAAGWASAQLSAWEADGLALLQATAGLGDPTAWFQAGLLQVQSGLAEIGAGVSSTAANVSLSLPVTTWAVILTGVLLLGGAAHGVILSRMIRSGRRAA